MQKGRRLISLLLITFLLLPTVALAGNTFDVASGSALLMEFSTGQVLFDKNADIPLPPASITKLMTLLLAFEALESGQVVWEEEVLISEKAWRMIGSKMYIKVDTRVKFGDLVTGVSVVSGNDASVAVAEHLYGSEEAFVRRMNEYAAELGMTNTRFQNSTGLPASGHEMSARDIAILARHLILNHPEILELESQRDFTYNNIWQENRNPLLGKYPGADGLKTGWTEEAGFCLVGTAEQDGVRMISVVLNTTSDQQRLIASQELLNHGFRNFRLAVAVSPGDIVGAVPVKHGRQTTVDVTVNEEVTVVAPAGRQGDIELVITEAKALEAPVTEGESAGTVEVQLDGETLAETELVAAEDAARANIVVRLWRAIARLFGTLASRVRR
ncbi:MAG: D-alanyl-D-alanine carboxypeptidase [Dethiobacter sp.]|nr:D-alanyl-D-alanine carboxypeptidase [Dethiobacter sp.]